MADMSVQRRNMVESQVRPSDITDRRITRAMMAVPRELFVPARLAGLAYSDAPLSLENGRGLMAPRDFARLVQLADIGDSDRVLDVGSCGGYSAAVLARLAGEVVALDSDSSARAAAAKALEESGATNVSCVSGPLQAGWSARAPYDVIILQGAVEIIPQKLKDQLAPRGRLVAVVLENGIGRAVVLRGGAEASAPRIAFEASAPRLAGLETGAKGFEF